MAEGQRGHQVYGRTHVSGYATVQQGDNFYINNIRIDQAVFNSRSIGVIDPVTASTEETRKRRRRGSEDDNQNTKRKCYRQRWMTGDSDRCLSGKEFASVLTALTMFLIGRHASGADIMRFIVRYRDDPWSQIATFAFAVGLTRYWMSHVPNSPSLLTDDRIILEDVFRQDVSVPFSIYADFSMLKAFLDVHYRDTPAEGLVKDGQFNLMLNSRRGLVLHEDDWSAKEVVKPKSLVVMAVYIRLQRPICVQCSSDLRMTETGEFWCETCERLYRDCHDLRYLNGLTVRGTKTSIGSSDLVEPLKRSSTQNSETCSSAGEERRRRADLSSLQNVDLELIPQQRPQRPGQFYSFVPLPGLKQHKLPRKRSHPIGITGLYTCGWGGCQEAYTSLNQLNAHIVTKSHGVMNCNNEEFKAIRRQWKARKRAEQFGSRSNRQVGNPDQ